MKEAKKTLIRVIILMWILAAVVIVIGIPLSIFTPVRLVPYVLGEVMGSAVSTLLMIHRYTTLDVELDLNKKSAANHLKMMASFRSLVSLLALFMGFYFRHIFFPFTVFTGLFATKAAALLYPVFFRDKGNELSE